MKIGIVRDEQINPSDAMTFQAVPGAVLCGKREIRCEMPTQVYQNLDEVLDANYDVLDVPDLMYPYTQELAARHPHVVCTVWENIPFNYWNEGVTPVLVNAKHFVGRSILAADLMEFYGIPKERISYIPAGVDCDLFSYKGLPMNERPLLLFVGRLTWEKGINDILFASAGQSWRLRFIGAGPESLDIVAKAQSLNVEAEVVEWTAHQDLPTYYQEADLLVYPSIPTPHWIEQFGISVIEAMACGTPAVTTQVGAFPDIQPPFAQWKNMVPPMNYLSLRNAIRSYVGLSRTEQERIRAFCRHWAETWFSSETVGRQLEEVYDSLAL